jgi:GNAT superfamily N-acetyltransferase
MILATRPPTISDVNHLLDIDIKCFDDTLPIDQWREVCLDPDVSKLVGTWYNTPVGFVLWSYRAQCVSVLRIGVKPEYRNKGVGTTLLQTAVIAARQCKAMSVDILVPESLCCPGSPGDVSQWLIAQNFRAKEILKDVAVYCGNPEDAYLFSFPIRSA